jgi:hypothetical protein
MAARPRTTLSADIRASAEEQNTGLTERDVVEADVIAMQETPG